MLAEERYKKILELLDKDRSVKVSKLINLFNVSIETVRRDLEYLEKEGHLKRVYGGAVLDKVDTRQQVFHAREKDHYEEKHELAQLASDLVEDGQSIAMDVSTTNLEIAKFLKQKHKNLTVITNSIFIANELADIKDYTVILAGGIVRKEEYSVTGDMCENNIRQFHVDLAFISASGISLNAGITDYGFGEVQAKKCMLEIAEKVVVACNSSRFDVVSLLKVCDLEKVDILVTDSNLNINIKDKYTNSGVEVITPLITNNK